MSKDLPDSPKAPFRIERTGSLWVILDSQGVNWLKAGCGLRIMFETEEAAQEWATKRKLPM